MELYRGKALIEEEREYRSLQEYWQWAPDVCRTSFLATDFRIEVDTSVETGIAEWNYLDYMKVYGTHPTPRPALPDPNPGPSPNLNPDPNLNPNPNPNINPNLP